MAGSRPSMASVQRSLIVGVLAGLIFGCLIGLGIGLYYAWQVSPAVYSGGAFPDELTENYQSHYIAMAVDSYNVTRQIEEAQRRLRSFDEATKVRALGEQSVAYAASGQAAENLRARPADIGRRPALFPSENNRSDRCRPRRPCSPSWYSLPGPREAACRPGVCG